MSTSNVMQAGLAQYNHQVWFTGSIQSIIPVRSHFPAAMDWSLDQLKNLAFWDMSLNGSSLSISLLINCHFLLHGFANQATQFSIINQDKLSCVKVLQCSRCKLAYASFLLQSGSDVVVSVGDILLMSLVL